jgi:hypothetical protein
MSKQADLAHIKGDNHQEIQRHRSVNYNALPTQQKLAHEEQRW